ncbi:MAG: hypothetical protein KJZ78_20145, partial [Bryobacteraceae bacterium]|nr:hypothetical protein [Bryobacteraceae bacterium]
DGQAQAEDHVTISFEGVSILLGHAFAVSAADGEAGLSLGTIRGRDQAVPVRKTWEPLPDGGAVLVESVSLAEAELLWGGLPKQTQARSTSLRNRRTVRVEQVEERRPVELAQAAYQPAGVIVDFETVTSANSFTFAMGQTYVVPGAAFLGPGGVTFQAGCTVKFATNAYILFYGPPTFTDTLQTPVFTSVNDDSFGEDVDGNPGGQPSVPSHHANPALWMYYLTSSTTVKNARVRWAKQGIHYDSNESSAPMNYLNHSLFERCQMGVYMNWYAKVTMSGVEKNDVAVPWQVVYPPPYGGSCPGCSMTQAPFYTGKSFAGLNGDSGYPVPDTMGAIGPSHFLEVLNDQVAVLRKATGQIEPDFTSQMTPSEFFAPGESLVFMDPRVWFDHGSQRWVVSAMHAENQGAGDKVVLKVSKTSTPNLDASNWWRYPVSFPSLPSEQWVDFPTLALDANGVYLSVQIRESSSIRHGFRILTFKKPDVYNGNYTPPAPLVVTNGELDTWCIQPAYNFDTVAAGAYVWLVAKGPNSGSQGGLIHYRRIQWNGANAQWVGSWVPVNAAYRDYYDIPQNSPLSAPQTVALGGTASRLMMATIRNSYLWTCHHVGLDGTDGDYDGPWPSAPDRSAVQWLRLKVDEGNLSYNAHGRIFDTVSTNPYWYHFPSVGVNAAGDSVAGFSGSRNGEYIGAFFRGRRANGTWMARPALVQAGRVAYAGSSWGDYSGTTIDPSDGSFWTVQEYADPVVFSSWGTWIVQVQVAQ